MRRVALASILALSPLSAAHAAAGTPPPPPAPRTVCDEIADVAVRHGLPVDYFTRLIWRESRFHKNAVSPAGARGVAQFMPGTAAERGLVDPFAVEEALVQSAGYLDDLRRQFGNLGLAAAAYNAGPGRVSRWRAGHAVLPQETIDYVAAVTGRDVAAWTASPPPELASDKDFSCERFAALAAKDRLAVAPSAADSPGKPWAVILIGNPHRDRVMAEYQIVKANFFAILRDQQPSVVHKRISGLEIARYIVQIEQDTRAGADALCARLQRAGGSCFVLANR